MLPTVRHEALALTLCVTLQELSLNRPANMVVKTGQNDCYTHKIAKHAAAA